MPSHNESFAQGHQMPGSPVVGSAGLAQQQAQENSAGPARVRPSGSGNGMSSGQSEQTMAGMLNTSNGQAADTYASKKWFENRPQ